MGSEDGSLELDLLAAALRQNSPDLDAFIEGLAVKLEQALPGNVRVGRVRRGLRGGKVTRSIELDAGGERLKLDRDAAGSIKASRLHISGGIVIRSEPLDIDAWTEALTKAVAAEAGRNEQTRQALERLLLS